MSTLLQWLSADNNIGCTKLYTGLVKVLTNPAIYKKRVLEGDRAKNLQNSSKSDDHWFLRFPQCLCCLPVQTLTAWQMPPLHEICWRVTTAASTNFCQLQKTQHTSLGGGALGHLADMIFIKTLKIFFRWKAKQYRYKSPYFWEDPVQKTCEIAPISGNPPPTEELVGRADPLTVRPGQEWWNCVRFGGAPSLVFKDLLPYN